MLFLAIFVLEIVLEIDNITALKKAAEGLPNTPLCRGQTPHALALALRIALAYVFLHIAALFAHFQTSGGHNFLGQFGGMLIILVSSGLVINYLHGGKKARTNLSRRIMYKKTSLAAFLFADAFLSLDTVIAAVAMTTSWNLAVAAMISAAVCIMLFEKPLHAWLEVNPRMTLIAYLVIGLLGVNLILGAHGIHIPKYALLIFVVAGLWFDDVDKKIQKSKTAELAQAKERLSSKISQMRGNASHLVETITPVMTSKEAEPSSSKVVPKTIPASWQEVVRKSEDTRDALAAEQLISGGAYDFTPEGKKISIAASNAAAAVRDSDDNADSLKAMQNLSANIAGFGEGYVYGTTHRAGIKPGPYGFILMGRTPDPLCGTCGLQQSSITSVCIGCGHYRFHLPAGIFEVGSLRLLTKRA